MMRRTLRLTVLLLAGALAVGATTACEEDDAVAGATVSDQVLFDTGEHELTQAARAQLEEVAEQIRSAGPGGTITLAGHTDDEGSDSYNQTLSERRAAEVQDALTDLLTDTDVTFEIEGYGATEPRAPNDSAESRAQNRRVEIAYWLS